VDTFVVRVSRVGSDEPGQLRGVVSRVANGHSVTFQTAEELLAFLVDPAGGQWIDEEATP
jgi:hypothetical protein